jgi:hypothetical protein
LVAGVVLRVAGCGLRERSGDWLRVLHVKCLRYSDASKYRTPKRDYPCDKASSGNAAASLLSILFLVRLFTRHIKNRLMIDITTIT